ncbi:MAG: 4'-phosphopantetheinyl transferase superfamily protein [Flavisolibacter sp.]|jgi:4'-phosphopantetheinyl transferase EntD|nr:4'-phosphopantetheinyl transferase superfamily protein [Flavisolibacter sp.]
MPIFFQQDIDDNTKLAVWKIEEEESFFLSKVPLQRDISHQHKRLQHLAGRYLLQYLFPGFPLELIRIADTFRPFLEDDAYHFSISHCGNYAAVIVSRNRRVGVDIEIPDAKVARIKNKFLHQHELRGLDLLNHKLIISNKKEDTYESYAAELRSLTLLWSSKEAIFKWWSFGKVDFRENIRLLTGLVGMEGSIEAQFISESATHLTVNYKIFEQICLAWVITE